MEAVVAVKIAELPSILWLPFWPVTHSFYFILNTWSLPTGIHKPTLSPKFAKTPQTFPSSCKYDRLFVKFLLLIPKTTAIK